MEVFMKCFLITGGAGFIGSNYIHYLMETSGNSIKVINLDLLNYCSNRSNVSKYENNKNYTFIKGDICDDELVRKIFSENDIDYVVHFAAQTHVDRSIESVNEFARTNVIGTVNLLNAAKEAWECIDCSEKRFLYISTDEVYGQIFTEEFFTEETPLNPRNPYSASKAAGDMMAHAFYETHNLPVLITRCSNNYGPYQFEEKFIPLIIKCCLTGKSIPIYGDGKNIRDWLYVTDHCKAINKVLFSGKIGEVYNVGGHNEYTNLDVVDKVLAILTDEFKITVSPVQFVKDRKGHDKRYAIDPAKIINELGWSEETSFQL
jgi:dTDP-glucose 4,6-dehydratase